MKHLWLIPLLGSQVPLLSAPTATREKSKTVWDLAEAGRFDWTNKAYSIDNGRVVVDLNDQKSLCPTGLGHLASGQDSVKEIVFRYRVPQAGHQWLHIIWDPGWRGKEQFEALLNGTPIGTSQLINGSETPKVETVERFPLVHKRGQNEIQLRHLSGDGLEFLAILLTTGEKLPAGGRVKPTLLFPTLGSYEKEIGEPGIVLDDDYVRFYAPKRKAREARIVHRYLVRAYDELYRIVGVHTKYRMVVYSLPKEHRIRTGGTSECTIWYSYKNLEFDTQPEWTRYRVPHVSGYIEEMAHNFVAASLAWFGWEMTGWSVSKMVSEKVAGNPIHQKSLVNARKKQAETFAEYKRLNNTFPKDIPPNLCDRIHAHLLHECEKQYGRRFWPNFFKEIRNSRDQLLAASRSKHAVERRDARYRITVDCFDRLMKGQFKKMLQEHGISLTTDVKSLQPKRPGWNRKLE